MPPPLLSGPAGAPRKYFCSLESNENLERKRERRRRRKGDKQAGKERMKKKEEQARQQQADRQAKKLNPDPFSKSTLKHRRSWPSLALSTSSLQVCIFYAPLDFRFKVVEYSFKGMPEIGIVFFALFATVAKVIQGYGSSSDCRSTYVWHTHCYSWNLWLPRNWI